jgi:CRISPR-associated protein Cmr2
LEAFFEGALGLDHHLFPSTASLATAAWRGRLLELAAQPEQAAVAAALENYTDKVKRFVKRYDLPYPAASWRYLRDQARPHAWGREFLRLDGDWLYAESYEETALANAYGLKGPAGVEECRQAAAALQRQIKEQLPELGQPPRYYALLAMDGDHMGNWVTGKIAPQLRWLLHPQVRGEPAVGAVLPLSNYPRPLGPALQLALSDSLKNFALYGARKIVEEDFAGKLIYAGGDDVLAFLPLEHLLPVMEKLYVNFRGLPDGFGAGVDGRLRPLLGGRRLPEPGDPAHEGMTVSMGVVIVHHSYPLYHALELVPGVLKQVAKKQLGRDAWAIRLVRRSGEVTEAGLPFAYEEETRTCRSLALLGQVQDLLQQRKLSGRLPYRLAETRWALGVDEQENLAKARELELRRLARQQSAEGAEAEVAQTLMELYAFLKNRLPQLDRWEALTKLLLIGRFLCGRED